MKKVQTTYDRVSAIALLDKFFDKIGVDESNRIEPNLSKEEKATIAEMKNSGASESEIQDFTERCDLTREHIITAIRKGYIVFDDESNITLKLRYPVESSEKTLCASELKFKECYKVKDIVKSVSGLTSQESPADTAVRLLSLRTGTPKIVISEMMSCDADLANMIERLFSKADLPMKD